MDSSQIQVQDIALENMAHSSHIEILHKMVPLLPWSPNQNMYLQTDNQLLFEQMKKDTQLHS